MRRRKASLGLKTKDLHFGMPVVYWGIIRENGEKFYPYRTTIDSEPWTLGDGTVVVGVAGKSGGVAVSHLERPQAEGHVGEGVAK